MRARVFLCPGCGVEFGSLIVMTAATPRERPCSACWDQADRIQGALLALGRVAVWMEIVARASWDPWRKAPKEYPTTSDYHFEVYSAIVAGRLRLTYPEGS